MKTLTQLGMGLMAAFVLLGCGSENKGTITTAAAVNCPLGSTNQGGLCVAPNGSIVNPGTGLGTGAGNVALLASDNWYNKDINITGSGFNAFLQNAMGACGPYGLEPSCTMWSSGAFEIIIASQNLQANQLNVLFRSKRRGTHPQDNSTLRSVPLNFTLSVTNNNQGFEARGYGDFNSPANRSLIQIQVATGKLEDNTIEYRMAYRGEIILTGRFKRCTKPDCGTSQGMGY